jgi:hypothetical protein
MSERILEDPPKPKGRRRAHPCYRNNNSANSTTSNAIAVYELRRGEYLRDVFVWAYTRSAPRYTAVRQSLGDPDPFRLKYRGEQSCEPIGLGQHGRLISH